MIEAACQAIAAETVTVVLTCRHLVAVPAPVLMPDVVMCPSCGPGEEREILRVFGEDDA